MNRILLLLPLLSLSLAQLSTSGEITLGVSPGVVSAQGSPQSTFAVTMSANFQARYNLAPVSFELVLDPQLSLADGSAQFEAGLTEAFIRYRVGAADITVGLERLPLEYARLSRPYSLEPIRASGQPQGLLGARAAFFTGDWRVRPALFYRLTDNQVGGALSVRRSFSQLELEAHLTYLERPGIGLGGSGLLGDTVLYGDLWLLFTPTEFRGALGASGFLGDSLWTLEAAYAPNPLVQPETPFPQLLGQLSIPQGASGSWEGAAGAGLVDSLVTDEPRLVLLATAGYSYTTGDYLLFTGGALIHTEFATVYALELRLTGYF
jgi:hypothetical protein